MKYSIEISKIIEGALKFDRSKVLNYSKLLINKLELDEDLKAAKKLSNLLEKTSESQLTQMNVGNLFKSPVDSESRISMADIIMPTSNVEIVLSEKNYKEIDTFLLSYENADKLYSLGIDFSNTMLMYGPPGCGKTKSAFYIASKLNLPLIVARLDSMISSYLGTTAKNIRNLFEYAQKTPCVLFLDEFDAIAKARDDNNELGELKRVVNSLLQNIDALGKNTILIAATNHEELLDKAIWRRFNYKLCIDFPGKETRKKLINMYIKNIVTFEDKELNMLAIATSKMSGSEIEEIINKSIQKAIIYQYDLKIYHIFNEIFELKLEVQKDNDLKEVTKEKVRYLRGLDEKVFSYSVIGLILNISKTQVSYIINN
ncbi:AAA family ATPase [Clostridium botulinum]|uniref:AAA family ATPase n=1 Tax=Clostridium botulinum TaxID=1491 RepID=UPI000773FB5F|nr:ATP-binding protein [Clostridium botulinum]NFF80407.1 AAA family ATPase [Clostridium botulinum]NFH80806.1 AAA family ATPase [Clostridium botulinum]NFH83183.1 AAA family ATPase [Clostridium botulinum]NFI12048.1 AAA family ATPase [Clostridium botulinum]NFI15803.1 AAA family ATPase [Clostridium botulinum]